MTLDDLGLL